MTSIIKLDVRVRSASLRDVRAEFRRVFKELNKVIGSEAGTNRSQISDMYIDKTTDELVITHTDGEKRIA